jgi:hypothetical protein
VYVMTNSNTLRNSTIAGLTIDNTTSAPVISNATRAGLQHTAQAIAANFIANAFGTTMEIDGVQILMALMQEFTNSLTLQLGATAITNQNITTIVNVQDAFTVTNLVTAPTMTNTFTGMSVDTHDGMHVDNHPGMHVDNHLGVHTDLHGGTHLQFDSTPDPIKIVVGTATKIDGGPSVLLNEKGLCTITSATHTTLATTHFKL